MMAYFFFIKYKGQKASEAVVGVVEIVVAASVALPFAVVASVAAVGIAASFARILVDAAFHPCVAHRTVASKSFFPVQFVATVVVAPLVKKFINGAQTEVLSERLETEPPKKFRKFGGLQT